MDDGLECVAWKTNCIWDQATLHEPEDRSPEDGAWSQISIMYIFMLNLFNIALYIDSISP